MSTNPCAIIQEMTLELNWQLESLQNSIRAAAQLADRLELAVRGAAALSSCEEHQSPDPANTAVAGYPECPQGSAPALACPSSASGATESQTSEQFHQSAEESVPSGDICRLHQIYQDLIIRLAARKGGLQ